MKAHRALSAGAVIGALIAVTSACAPQSSSSTTITVGAASSLTEVLVTIGEDYMAANPEVTVTFSFAGSSAIAEQIRSGAPLDAFASAGTSSMEPLATEGLVTDVTAFATNTLMIATPPGNPGGVTGLADLPGATVLVCQEQVP